MQIKSTITEKVFLSDLYDVKSIFVKMQPIVLLTNLKNNDNVLLHPNMYIRSDQGMRQKFGSAGADYFAKGVPKVGIEGAVSD